MSVDFKTAYQAFRVLYCNPDSDDVIQFMYVYEQIEKGRDLNDILEETEPYMEKTGYRYPPEYRKTVKGY